MSTVSLPVNTSHPQASRVSSQLTDGGWSAYMLTFAEWLKEKRRVLDMTQDMVAEKAGFEKAYISKLEKKDSVTPLDTVDRIAKAFGTTIDEPLIAMGYIKAGNEASGQKSKLVTSRFARLYFKHEKLKKSKPGRRKEFERVLDMVERDYDRELIKPD